MFHHTSFCHNLEGAASFVRPLHIRPRLAGNRSNADLRTLSRQLRHGAVDGRGCPFRSVHKTEGHAAVFGCFGCGSWAARVMEERKNRFASRHRKCITVLLNSQSIRIALLRFSFASPRAAEKKELPRLVRESAGNRRANSAGGLAGR